VAKVSTDAVDNDAEVETLLTVAAVSYLDSVVARALARDAEAAVADDSGRGDGSSVDGADDGAEGSLRADEAAEQMALTQETDSNKGALQSVTTQRREAVVAERRAQAQEQAVATAAAADAATAEDMAAVARRRTPVSPDAYPSTGLFFERYLFLPALTPDHVEVADTDCNVGGGGSNGGGGGSRDASSVSARRSLAHAYAVEAQAVRDAAEAQAVRDAAEAAKAAVSHAASGVSDSVCGGSSTLPSWTTDGAEEAAERPANFSDDPAGDRDWAAFQAEVRRQLVEAQLDERRRTRRARAAARAKAAQLQAKAITCETPRTP
jgi:hypothetical protein